MVSTDQRLRESGLFNAISGAEFESVVASVIRSQYSQSQIIVRQGDPGDDMFLIDEGTVEVYTVTPDGEELSLVKLSEGDYFGEQALLPGQPGRRKAFVRADTDCCLLKVNKEAFQNALSKDNSLQEEMDALSQSQMQQKLAQLSQLLGVVKDAKGLTGDAVNHIQMLGGKSLEISQITKVIDSVASQTRYLALNATIEAARAGESGRGFKVVASEVKNLAKETAASAESIQDKIDDIQSSTMDAIQYIEKIAEIINKIEGISETMASSMEEMNL